MSKGSGLEELRSQKDPDILTSSSIFSLSVSTSVLQAHTNSVPEKSLPVFEIS